MNLDVFINAPILMLHTNVSNYMERGCTSSHIFCCFTPTSHNMQVHSTRSLLFTVRLTAKNRIIPACSWLIDFIFINFRFDANRNKEINKKCGLCYNSKPFPKHAVPIREMSTVCEAHLPPTNLSSLDKYDNSSGESQELSQAWQLNRIKLSALCDVRSERRYLWTGRCWPPVRKCGGSAFPITQPYLFIYLSPPWFLRRIIHGGTTFNHRA